MKMLYIFLDFGTSMTEPLSDSKFYTLVGLGVLLVALFIIFLIRTNKIIDEKNKSRSEDDIMPQSFVSNDDVEEETAAAIALAIHLYKTALHDQESFTITLKKVSKIYSPWSSKIYTLRQNPR